MAARARSHPLLPMPPSAGILAAARDHPLLPQVWVEEPAPFPGLPCSPAGLIELHYRPSSLRGG